MTLGKPEPLNLIDEETSSLVASVGDQFNRDDPMSLYNQLPPIYRRTLDGMPLALWDDPERVRQGYLDCTPVDRALRKAIWAEYTLARARNERMNLHKLCEGICSYSYIYTAGKNPRKVFFFLSPPISYIEEMKDLQDLGLQRIREMLTLPFEDAKGNKDPKIMKLVLQAFAMVDARIHGAPKQSIEQTNRNANLNVSLTGTLEGQQHQTMEEIEAKLAEVQSKIQGKPMAELEPPNPMETILHDMRGASSKKGMDAALAAEYAKVKAAEDE